MKRALGIHNILLDRKYSPVTIYFVVRLYGSVIGFYVSTISRDMISLCVEKTS